MKLFVSRFARVVYFTLFVICGLATWVSTDAGVKFPTENKWFFGSLTFGFGLLFFLAFRWNRILTKGR